MAKNHFYDGKYAFPIEALPPPKPKTDEIELSRRPLSVTELSKLLGWSRSKIEKFRNMGVIPFHQIGSSYPFYYIDEVLDALKNSATSSGPTE